MGIRPSNVINIHILFTWPWCICTHIRIISTTTKSFKKIGLELIFLYMCENHPAIYRAIGRQFLISSLEWEDLEKNENTIQKMHARHFQTELIGPLLAYDVRVCVCLHENSITIAQSVRMFGTFLALLAILVSRKKYTWKFVWNQNHQIPCN